MKELVLSREENEYYLLTAQVTHASRSTYYRTLRYTKLYTKSRLVTQHFVCHTLINTIVENN